MYEKVMQKQALEQDNTKIHELLEVEEIPDDFDSLAKTESVTVSTEIQNCIRLFNNSNVALMILDINLMICHISNSTHKLFRDYYTIERRPFFNIFRQVLDSTEMHTLLTDLKSEKYGYTWTGTLQHKTPTARTLFTQTNIVPFFSLGHSLAGYLVFFNDITKNYHAQSRSTFNSILDAAKLKDNDTGLHAERVGHYSRSMAEYLYNKGIYPQIDPDFVEDILFLAAMHDVGKIGTPDYILLKPGKLTDQEWGIMREHTINGALILASYPSAMAKEIALSHHEWWNGAGYPYKLEGEMIPLPARITTIADVYDALRMKRTYKTGFTHKETVQKILAGKGIQFDPTLIDAFTVINEDFDIIWNRLKDVEKNEQPNRDRSKEFSEFE